MKNAKYGVPAVQSYAFGGIANPTQMATLRSSDKEYLDARQKELDEFEKQRIAYNDSLAKWQTEVYNPYKTQLDAYNAAAEKYNAGPRTEDFTLSVPVTPEDFKMAAPVVPFKEEEVVARQKEAAARATQDAGNRAVAIDVVSDPDRFNFGSMSVSNRFMAQGGEVKSMADDVAAAGRNGDELLAYLSPEALRLLKENGGSGTINPETGLPEFFSDTLKNILVELPKLEAAAAAEKAAAEKAAADAKELADFRAKEAAVSARWNEAVPSKPATTTAAADLDTAIRQLKAGDNAAANLTMRQIVGLDPIPSTAIPNTPVAKPVPTFGQAPAIKTAPVATPGQTPAIKTAPVATFTPAVPPPPPGPRPPSRADETEWSAKSRPKSEPVIDMQVVVYGPDGKMYSSPAQARTAGVTNYTMEPPKAPPVTPPAATVPRSAPISTPSIPYTPPAMPGQVQPGMRNPASQPAADIPISMPAMPTYSSRGVGAVGTADSVANKNYFAMTPETSTGLAPGSAAIGPADMPLAGAKGTLNAMGLNKNLSPTMLGGAQNAGYTTDRLGNRIYGFARGGGVDVNALLAQNTETLSDEVPDDVINTNPVGTAQKMLADLGNVGKVSPTRQSIKRVRTAPGGGATADKSMQMPFEGLGRGDLGAMKDVTPAAKNTDSARAQMEELARVYQLKIRAAQNKAKGLSADTFGAPTLEGPTLTKGKLTKKRFAEGGEAKKPGAESAKEPSIFSVKSYATDTSERMFPDQMGEDDERDAARHMLAAATLSRKFGPRTAKFLGKAYERTSSPESFFSMFGIGKPREDYEMDVHNNKVGVDLGSRATSQEELEKLVRAMAMQSQNKQVEGKPWTMSDEQQRNRKPREMTPRPEYRAEGSPVEGELSQEEIDAASRPAFVTPKSGKGRKQGEISRQLQSGEAYTNMAKGVTELPYDLAGAPVDLATMAMRPFGYGTEKPVMGSDFIKEKMTKLGVRPEPPADPTAKGFYTAGEMLSNLTNPAGVTRSAVKGAKKTGEAATAVAKDFQEYNRQLAVPGASYVSRAPGGYFPTSRTEGGILSNLDKAFDSVLKQVREVDDPEQRKALTMLFNQKAKDFYTKQAGSIQDPLRADILSGALKFDDDAPLADAFPRTLQKNVAQGDLQALRLLEKNYDRMMGIRSVVPRIDGTDGVQGVPEAQIMANIQANLDKIPDSQLLAYAGKKPKQGPAGVAEAAAEVREKLKNNPTLFSTVLEPRIARTLFVKSSYNTDADIARYPGLYGTTATEAMVTNPGGRTLDFGEAVPPGYFLPDLETAINKGQPIQDIDRTSVKLLGMTTDKLLSEARQIPVEELNQMGFTDFLKRAYASSQQVDKFEAALPKVKKLIQDGKAPPADIMTYGVKDYIPTMDDFRWVKVVKPDGVRAIAAGMNNSVASYATSSTYGSLNKGRAALDKGEAEIYSLYDKNNVPHVTVEYLTSKPGVPDAKKNTIAQLTGNGPMTANAIPENYAPQIVDLLNNLRPSSMPPSIKRVLEKTGQKNFLTEEALAPLYFGVPIEAMRTADDNLLRQLGAP